MKKTAMQLLLLKAEMDGYNRPQWWWKEQIENLLETEQEQIEEAYEKGCDNAHDWHSDPRGGNLTAKQYYKETYG